MKLDKYLEQHPDMQWHIFTPGPDHPEYIRAGVLQFNEDTACSWGGPWPGDVAFYVLWDCRLGARPLVGLPFEHARDKARNTVQRWMENAYRLRARDKAIYEEYLSRIEAGDADVIHMANEWGSADYPFKLWVYGNDDTSYSRWFRTREDAEEFIDLLEAAEPLDMQRDFLAFPFTFTN